MKNLEIKAKCKDFNCSKQAIKNIGAIYNGVLNQTDIYFQVKQGRLKMRIINNNRYEIIYYQRANSKTERYSNYEIVNLKNGKELLSLLTRSLNILCEVKKKRELYIYENVRIHLDTVEKLGKFIEFEIVCKSKTDEKEAPGKMKFLKKKFEIRKENLVKYSYSDIIFKKELC
jgi:adenylate cyclase, class 2